MNARSSAKLDKMLAHAEWLGQNHQGTVSRGDLLDVLRIMSDLRDHLQQVEDDCARNRAMLEQVSLG